MPTRAERAAAAWIVAALALGWFLATVVSHRSGPWDNIEQLVWTQAIQWGYYKHPPLPTWLLAAATLPFGPRIEVTWALGISCVAIGLWLTWRLGCELMSVRRATVGLLLSSTVAYYSVRALYYNHNLAMLPFVSAAALLLHRALRDGRPRQWIGFGVAAGLGALCKYQIVIFAACWGMAVLLAARGAPGKGRVPGVASNGSGVPDRSVAPGESAAPAGADAPSAPRRRLSPATGLALAALAGTVVISPHLLWLIEHDFLPFRYADRQLERLDGAGAWLANLASFASVQMGRCAPVALAVALSVWRLRRQARRATSAGTAAGPLTRWIERSFARSNARAVGTGTGTGTALATATAGSDGLPSRAAWRFLLLVGMGPFALTWAMGLADVRLEGHWSTPELLALGLVIAARWPAADTARALAAVAAVVAALQAVMAAGFAIGRGVLPHLTGTVARSTYPVHAVADAIASQWRARTDAPLVLVAGETWEAGTVALNVSPRARVIIDADLTKSPGVDADLVARCGAMVVWDTSREADLPDPVVRLRAAGGERGMVTVRWSDAPRARPVELGWTMIPPHPHATCTGRGTAARP